MLGGVIAGLRRSRNPKSVGARPACPRVMTALVEGGRGRYSRRDRKNPQGRAADVRIRLGDAGDFTRIRTPVPNRSERKTAWSSWYDPKEDVVGDPGDRDWPGLRRMGPGSRGGGGGRRWGPGGVVGRRGVGGVGVL